MTTHSLVRHLISALLLGAALFAAPPAHAKEGCACCAATPVSAQDSSVWLAKAKAEYPLSTCVISGDKLEGGDMGGPVDYVYKQEGKPDRLVRFCCKSCIKTFNKNPEKYLALIDAAAKAKQG